jgi:hypothetical protein
MGDIMATAQKAEVVVNLKPINVQRMQITIEGTSPLIMHQWSEKAKRQMREKGTGKKTKEREVRNPEAESRAATYMMKDGKYGVPLLALKSAIITAAHKDLGIEKTLVRKALFIRGNTAELMLPMVCSKPTIREDFVRVGNNAADIRYRPHFEEWSVAIDIEYDADLLQPGDIVNLINRAGFGVGICEWRPENGGEFGRFRVRV